MDIGYKLLFAGYAILLSLYGYKIATYEKADVGLLIENAYIMGYERREAEYFDEVAAIASEIHGHHGVPVPERKPR